MFGISGTRNKIKGNNIIDYLKELSIPKYNKIKFEKHNKISIFFLVVYKMAIYDDCKITLAY